MWCRYLATFLGLVFLGAAVLVAQAPEPIWLGTYGGRGDDVGYAVEEADDGGYIIAGYTDSFGGGHKDVYLLKVDDEGNVVWEEAYGGENDEWGYAMRQTADGGYIIVGAKRSAAGDRDVYLIKVDSSRRLRWQRTYGGAGDDVGYAVAETPDGGYIVVGYTYGDEQGFDTDVYLIKTDAKGRALWEETYGEDKDDKGYAVQAVPGGGYIIVGYTTVRWGFGSRSQLDSDVYLLRVDEDGGVLWEKTYGGELVERGRALQATSDGGYIIAGYTVSDEGDADFYLLKTDGEGRTLWTKIYGGMEDDEAYSVQETSDGGYIVAGYTKSSDEGDADLYLLKIDAEGDLLWAGTYGEADDDVGHAVRETADGGYIVAGSRTYSSGIHDVYLLKVGPSP